MSLPFHPHSGVDPASYTISVQSATRLSALTDLPADTLAGLTVSEARERFAAVIDPTYFWFRKVCGSVVKTDPVTGTDYPVPFATVNVEDTDCCFLGFFPVDAPWGWYFPFHCHREVIATVQTDACGKFCAWVPGWDIEWVLRFRIERRCYPIIFQRPSLQDVIEQFIPKVGPGPDPGPLNIADRARLAERVSNSFGRDASLRVIRSQTTSGFGSSTVASQAALGAPALLSHLRPPLPAEMRLAHKDGDGPHPGVTALAGRLDLEARALAAVDPRRFIGPFNRCFDVIVPEWVPIFDVPDITFSVWQDTDGDGDLEQIYGETYFDVRWDAGPIGPVILHAGPNSIAGPLCGPTNIPCGDVPAIVTVGFLPVNDPNIYDVVNGFGVITNRPHPSGKSVETLPVTDRDSQAPMFGGLALYGCNKTDPAATRYRLVYRYSADNGATFTSPAPFVGQSWPLNRLNGLGINEAFTVSADAQGWYLIALPPGPNDWLPADLLLDWDSSQFANGLYKVTLQLGDAGGVTSVSAEVGFTVDNSVPTASFTVETAFSPAGPFTPISGTCPVVRRGTSPADVYFRVTLDATAAHLRSLSMSASDCGAGGFSAELSGDSGGFFEPSGGLTYDYWHALTTDTHRTLTAVYKLAASAPPGTYTFSGQASSRAFNPSGWDSAENLPTPWLYDPDDIYLAPRSDFSVVNEPV